MVRANSDGVLRGQYSPLARNLLNAVEGEDPRPRGDYLTLIIALVSEPVPVDSRQK